MASKKVGEEYGPIIFEWETLAKDYPAFDDFFAVPSLPEAYRVIKDDDRTDGIRIYVRRHGQWEKAGFGGDMGLLIKHLIELLKATEQAGARDCSHKTARNP